MIDYTRALELAIRYQTDLRGWKMGDLIKKTGIRSTTFNERLKGKRPWTLDEIDRISKAFGMEGAYTLLCHAQNVQIEANHLDENGKPKPDPWMIRK